MAKKSQPNLEKEMAFSPPKQSFFKKQLWPKKPNSEQLSPITIDDIDPILYAQLETKFYQNFQFEKLYQAAVEDGLIGKIIPYISCGLALLNLFILFGKK